VEKLTETFAEDKRLALPESKFFVPLALTYPQQGSILFETNKGGENEAIATNQQHYFSAAVHDAGSKASFTIFDPVGLGQNFAALMHLADYEEGGSTAASGRRRRSSRRSSRTERAHGKSHPDVLRNEYATIAEYNARAGSIAEKYHFLVIASFR